jgi:hypothetical protein
MLVVLVQVTLPVSWNTTGGARYGLADRVAFGRSKRRTFADLVGGVVPEPILSWLKTPNHGVPSLRCMFCRVLRGRAIAASNMAACGTSAKMEPPAFVCKALDAAVAGRWNSRIDQVFSHVSMTFRRSGHRETGRFEALEYQAHGHRSLTDSRCDSLY